METKRCNNIRPGQAWLPFPFDGEMAYLDRHDEGRFEDCK